MDGKLDEVEDTDLKRTTKLASCSDGAGSIAKSTSSVKRNIITLKEALATAIGCLTTSYLSSYCECADLFISISLPQAGNRQQRPQQGRRQQWQARCAFASLFSTSSLVCANILFGIIYYKCIRVWVARITRNHKKNNDDDVDLYRYDRQLIN